MRIRNMLVLCAGLSLIACSWVKLTPEGEKVRVLTQSEVHSCKNLGKTRVSVADKVAGLERKPHIVQENLNILARNSAANMGGDSIVPASPEQDGKQVFDVYRCIGP